VIQRLRDRRGFSFADANQVVLGAVTILAIAGMIGAVFAVGTLGVLKHRYSMSGVFHDSSGIRAGDTVRVAGIDVGQVTGIEPDFQLGQVVVTWEVDEGVHLGTATTAEIAVATLLGGMYLRLGGPVTKPYLESLPGSQRRVPLERTKTPYTVTDTLGSATRAVQQLDVGNVDTLLTQLGDLTADNRDDIGQLATDIAAIAGAVNDRQHELDTLLTNAQTVTDTLAAKDTQLASLVDHAGSLLDVLAKRRDDLATLLGAGSQVVSTLSMVITDHRAQLSAIIDDLHATLAVTDAHLPELNRTLAFVGPTFAGFSKITQQGAWLEAVVDGLPAVDLINLIRLVLGTP
jgi:phospholipid/cholesterol/gamma-HCH transport system substrate-binding protein